MVDIHTHILPGVDDGSDSFEESLLMLKRAVNSGVDVIVATPHWLPGSFMVSNDRRDALVKELQARADAENIPIQIVSGRECYFAPEIFQVESDLTRFTIGGRGRYLLIESPMQQIPSYVEQMIFDIQVQGITPIIAHVERYAEVVNNPAIVGMFLEKECLIQVNMGSLRGRYGSKVRETAITLLQHRMAHIVASDMHTSRSAALGEGFFELSRLVGEKEARALVDTRPRAVVNGDFIERPEPLPLRSKKSWWKFW